MNSIAEKNKKIILKLYQEAYLSHTGEFIKNYFHDDFIQHNHWLHNGGENVQDMHLLNFQFHLVNAFAQRDLVAVYGYYQLEDSMSAMAFYGVDIWRLADEKIVEHWDVMELLPYEEKETILGNHTKATTLDLDQMSFNTGLVNIFSYLAFADKDMANVDSFISDDFVFHYKQKLFDLDELRSHLLSIPDNRYEINHIIASDDHVIIHSYFKSGNIKKAGIEIYRTNKQCKIEEMWSLSQEFILVKKAVSSTSYQ